MSQFSAKSFNLELLSVIAIWTMSCYIERYRIRFIAVIFFLVYPVFFVFVFRLLRICVTVFFATYLLLLIYSSALIKEGSGVIVRFSFTKGRQRGYSLIFLY